MSEKLLPCRTCGGRPMLCEPNFADEGGTMVVCEDCDDAGESFDLGKYGEGRALAIAAWNKRAPSPGTPAMNNWKTFAEDTSWIDGRDIVLLARDMEVQARYCPGEWSDDTPISPAEYSGAVWSCFDDEFQIEIEECSADPAKWEHHPATHWREPTERPRA